jgi:BNR repeat-like domain
MIVIAFLFAASWLAPEGRQPQVAASGDAVSVAYGRGNDVFVMNSEDAGKSWGDPVALPRRGVMSLGMRRGPRIVRVGKVVLVSAIGGEKGRGADGDLWLWRSEDGGKSWSAGSKLNDVEGAAREGLHAMAGSGGKVYAAWLDLRSKGTKIVGTMSQDGGKTWSANRVIYTSPSGSVCECCHPSLAVNAKGEAWVMFRNSINGRRDMYVQAWAGGEARKLGLGEWVLNACPMDGGMAVVDKESGKIFSVWRREKKIFAAWDGAAEVELGEGKHPIAWQGPDKMHVLWMEGPALRDKEGVVVNEGAYPAAAALPNGKAVVVYEAAGKIQIEVK